MLPDVVYGHGMLRVAHGRGPLARAVARVLRLPRPGPAVETRLVITPSADGEHWHRTFADRQLDTYQYRSPDGGLIERFRHLELRFQRQASHGGTSFHQLGAAFVFGPLRVPLPSMCAPRVTAREDPAGPHRIHVDVRIELPALGALLTYDGTIDVEDNAGERAQRVEPRERSAPAQRRASERAGESEGRSPSDKR
jgi:hypothetical protein